MISEEQDDVRQRHGMTRFLMAKSLGILVQKGRLSERAG